MMKLGAQASINLTQGNSYLHTYKSCWSLYANGTNTFYNWSTDRTLCYKERFITLVRWMGFFFGLQEIHEQMNNEELQSFEQGSGYLKYTRELQLLFWVVTRKV